MVRELFRNLVTAEGTRATRERGELLSVFDENDRQPAGRILDALVDARLLTSYELPAAEGEERGRHRIEIVHESLLTAWPRLVRWRTQDEEGAQLRDELRQAARIWEQHQRSDDLLWSGTAFHEYQLWRERYGGGLTELEESFAGAMTAHAGRRRRHRRIAVATVLAVLAVVLAVVTGLWRESVEQTRRAEAAADRAEASRLVTLGEFEFEEYPTAALAWATTSLEVADSLEARLLALRALSRGPPVTVLRCDSSAGYGCGQLAFSPSGRWLATGFGKTHVWSHDGGDPIAIPATGLWHNSFARDDLLVTGVGAGAPTLWSIPDGRELRRDEGDRGKLHRVRGDGYFSLSARDRQYWLHWWPLDGGAGRPVGGGMLWFYGLQDDIDASGSWLAYIPFPSDQRSVFVRSLRDWSRPPRRLGTHSGEVKLVTFDPAAEHVAAGERSGEVRIWPVRPRSERPPRTLHSRGVISDLVYDPSGRRLAATDHTEGPTTVSVWDLAAPRGAAPLTLLAGPPGPGQRRIPRLASQRRVGGAGRLLHRRLLADLAPRSGGSRARQPGVRPALHARRFLARHRQQRGSRASRPGAGLAARGPERRCTPRVAGELGRGAHLLQRQAGGRSRRRARGGPEGAGRRDG